MVNGVGGGAHLEGAVLDDLHGQRHTELGERHHDCHRMSSIWAALHYRKNTLVEAGTACKHSRMMPSMISTRMPTPPKPQTPIDYTN